MDKQRVETTTLPIRRCIVKTDRTEVRIGSGEKLAVIAGPCVVEDERLMMQTARQLVDVCERLDVGLIFKSSYEKDNRGSERNFRGPMLDDGLQLLKKIKKEFGVPVLSDIHRHDQIEPAAEVLDVLQIPAYLCQQTSLVLACGKTGRAVNVKKGQFLAPENMSSPVGKLRSVGNENVLLTERGACFGYNRLVADMRSIPVMQELGAPVVFDATHVIRLYGISSADPAGGEPRFVPHLTLAAVAAGCDALFLENHPNPMAAKCDGASQLNLKHFESLMTMAVQVRKAIGRPENVGLMEPAAR